MGIGPVEAIRGVLKVSRRNPSLLAYLPVVIIIISTTTPPPHSIHLTDSLYYFFSVMSETIIIIMIVHISRYLPTYLPTYLLLTQVANLTLKDISRIEINEAFAAQFLACSKELGLDPEKTNIHCR